MDLNQLTSSRLMCEDEKGFELDMNYIDMQEMDFDLSKKDQDSPENYDFAEIVRNQEHINDANKKDQNMMEEQIPSQIEKDQH